MHTERSTLPSGLTILETPLADAVSFSIIVAVPVGSRHEQPAEAGLAHFFEHMVFKGGAKYKTATVISETLDQYGAQFNAFTDVEMTAFYVKIAAAHWDVAVDVLADILQHAQFPEAELEREKGVVLEEYKMYWDMPDARADMQIGPAVFGSAAVGRPVIGEPSTIKSFTRDSLVGWRQKYAAERMVISVAGKLPAGIRSKLASAFAKLAVAEPLPTETVIPLSDGPKWVMDARKGEQTQLILGWPGLKATDDRSWTLHLLRTVLGGFASSRLFTEIREKRGLCYSVRAFEQSFMDVGLWGISAGLDAARLPEALEAIWKEVDKIAAEPVGVAELNRAKEYIKGTTVLGLESPYSVAWWRTQQWLTEGKLYDLPTVFKRVDEVTAAQVQNLACDLMPLDRLGVVLVGPKTPTTRLAKILH